MKILLYKAFPDHFRQSMLVYAHQLEKELKTILPGTDEVRGFLPNGVLLRPAPMRYLSHYIYYQLMAAFQKSDIHHITDHAYAHLGHSLNPRKTIVTFHDAIRVKEILRWNKSDKMQCLLHYNKAALKKAARIICDSEAGRNDFLEWTNCPSEKVKVIPLGVEHSLFTGSKGDPFQALGIPERDYILHTGHVGSYKNIPALFYVLAELKKRGKSIHLLKTGMPFTSKQARLAKELGVDNLICYLGLIKREKMPFAYRAASVFIFPSLDEGFGFPVLEAMAAGLPVISSNRGSLKEIVGRGGVSLDPDNYGLMADEIVKMMEQKEYREAYRQRGEANAAAYSWKKTAEKTLEVYRSVFEDDRKK